MECILAPAFSLKKRKIKKKSSKPVTTTDENRIEIKNNTSLSIITEHLDNMLGGRGVSSVQGRRESMLCR